MSIELMPVIVVDLISVLLNGQLKMAQDLQKKVH